MVRNIELSSTVYKNIHKPKTMSGYTLYTKVPDCLAIYNRETKAETDPEYMKKSKMYYNSPQNIKRIFITSKFTAVQYHCSPIINNSKAKHWTKGDNIDKKTGLSMYEIGEHILNYNKNMQEYKINSAINKNEKQPDEYSVSGRLNILTSHYTASNIEEVYFDWSLLLSQDVREAFGLNCTAEQIVASVINIQKPNIQNNSTILSVFKNHNRGKFPRLREVTYISSLDDILQDSRIEGFMKDIPSEHEGTYYDTWYDVNKQIIESYNTAVLRGRSNVKYPCTIFESNPSIYLFDKEELSNYILEYCEKCNKNTQEILYKQNESDNNNNKNGKNSKNTLDPDIITDDVLKHSIVESRLLEIGEKYSNGTKEGIEEVMTSVFIYAFNNSGLTKEEITKELRKMTNSTKKVLAKAVNISL